MAANKLREPVTEEQEEVSGSVTEAVEEPKPRKRKRRGPGPIARVMNLFGVFDREQIIRNMPFILFLALLLIGYIANNHYAENVIRTIDRQKSELKEKRAEYISTKSELVSQSKQSEVARMLLPTDIKESTVPPKKLVLPASDKK